MNPRFREPLRVVSLATLLLVIQLIDGHSALPIFCNPVSAQNQDDFMPKPTLSDPESLIEVSIPSVAGQIQWSDVATEVGDQLKLDPDSLRGMLPSGSLDLGSPSVILTLFAINMAANDAVSFSIGQDEVGGQALKVRCRRSFFTGNAIPAASSISKSSPVVDLDSDWGERTVGKSLVVFLHGMNSGPKTFDAMRREVRKHGFATASVGYDYDQSISVSADQAIASLKTAFVADASVPDLSLPDISLPDISLVGHSMGGLVARHMTESPGKIPGEVQSGIDRQSIKQLITIGTPHRGSNWASLPPLSDMFAPAGMDADDMMNVILHQPSSLGIQDLIPGSPFLQTLNARDRRKDVRYTAIMGTASPVNESQVTTLRQLLQSMDQQGTLLRLIRPRIKPLLGSFDELTAGKGDGIVSVESARLPGVSDSIEVSVSHFEMILQDRAAGKSPVLDIVLDRLKPN